MREEVWMKLMRRIMFMPAGRKNIRKSRTYIPEMRENEERNIRREL